MKVDKIKCEFQMCKDLSVDKPSYLGMLKYKSIDREYVSKLPDGTYNALVESFLIPTTWQIYRTAKNGK